MKYSIIIPVYNGENHIYTTLENLLNAPKDNYEVIVVNDGSTDNTLDILNKIKLKFNRLKVVSQTNAGPASARNTGIKQAAGEYIIFVDADDFLDMEILDYVDQFEGDFDLFIYNFLYDNGEKIIRKQLVHHHKSKNMSNEDILYLYLDGLINSPCNKVYKKSIIKKHNIHFDESLRMGEDLIYNLNYLEFSNNIIFEEVYFYTYWVNNVSSVSSELPNNYFENQIYLFETVLDFFKNTKVVSNGRSIQKLYADFMKNISNYMKKSADIYEQSQFDNLMKGTLLTEKTRILLKRISLTDLTWSHKIIYYLIQYRQFKLIYRLYNHFK